MKAIQYPAYDGFADRSRIESLMTDDGRFPCRE
jgi:hypothetical protein